MTEPTTADWLAYAKEVEEISAPVARILWKAGLDHNRANAIAFDIVKALGLMPKP